MTTSSEIKNYFVREVKVSYRSTKKKVFKIKEPADVATFVRRALPDNSREHFVALYLDGAHQVAAYSIISSGTANMAQVHPREIFQRAVVVGAVSLVIAHNHPSGEMTPSPQDLTITDKIRSASEIMGIRFLDHIIVTDSGFRSLSLE